MSAPIRIALCFAVFAGAVLFLMGPGLRLPFFSDDAGYVEYNEFVHELSGANVAAILDPWGQPARDTANYAPVHLLAHALEWSLFAKWVVGYHVVNFLLHALVATLLVELLLARGLPLPACVMAGAVFAVHPANVETAVWIFQIKTLLALAFAVGALLAHPRFPWLGALLFALALLCKIPALFALPVAAVWSWISTPRQPGWRERWRWIVGWAAIALACSVPQFIVFERGVGPPPLGADALETFRTIVAIGARYIAMAYTGTGTSPFHAPDAAASWLDPWWLAGLVLGGAFAWRLVTSLLQRREEAAWWIWAAGAYAPISQVFPFRYAMADRYLYFILPGLIGGTLFAVRELWPRVERAAKARGLRVPGAQSALRGAALAAAVVIVSLGVMARAQARVWRLPTTVMLAAARNYPNGLPAYRMRAYRAAALGDAATAAAELRGARERGFDRFMDIEGDAHYAAVRNDPEFDAVMRDIAGDWIATIRARSSPTHYECFWLAQAHILRDELPEAEAALEQALRIGGEFDPQIRAQLVPLRRELRRRAAAASVDPAAGHPPE